jgi:lipopolysaccharide biosynthesis glycosyltransferase
MKTTGPITIVVATDDLYVVLLAALIKSIEKHNSSNRMIHLHIIKDHVSKFSKKNLEHSIDNTKTVLFWIDVADVVLPGYKIPSDKSSWPTTIHLRLFIPYLMPVEVEKILYLDVDMILQRNIAELYDTELGDQILGAVTDQRVLSFDNSWGGGIKNYQELGLDGQSPYFNTGLLLINCKKWRDNDITAKVIACIEANRNYANFPDQYGLNVALVNQWKPLNPYWNYFSNGADLNAYLIHFVERKPIFSKYKGNIQFKKRFYELLKNTAWENMSEKSELKWFGYKLRNKLKKFLNL